MKKIMVGALAVTVVLGGVGLINHGYAQEKTEKVNTSVQSKQLISIEEAKAKALEKVAGEIESIELDDNVYEVDVNKGNKEYDIDIYAYTGEIVKFKQDNRDNDDDDDDIRADLSNQAIITVEKAVKIAQGEIKGEVIETNLDEDDGRYEYEIELRTNKGDVDVTIDAVTGKVLEIDN
ncbi:PepSY domain-containing protein [Metabacillus fastidiosus]|uniref:PepSY domain-containing protein n=1 Tax=Metabacillus fastidiosus TaxID=1458 RepID=UPI00082546AA|nr:PepSY domain-containing protein [Metabacillus fastidiosus]MED4464463.1 PepSY domain-containing protein [Metabacillus fastidiosus]